MSLLNNLCDFCHGDIIKGFELGTEYFCDYDCYNNKYNLEEEEEY